jgi:hypothetical protein
MFSGALLPVFKRYAPWYYPAAILTIIGSVLMFKVSSTTKTAAIYGFEVMISIGVGLVFQTGYAVAAIKGGSNRASASIGFINIAQIGSISITLAIAGSISQNVGYVKLRHALSVYNISEQDLRSALAGSLSAIFQRGDERVKALALNAVVETISETYALVIAAGAVMLVSGFSMSWENLDMEATAGG